MKDKITQMLEMSDEQLGEAMGFPARLQKLKDELARAGKLTGAGRNEVNHELEEMLSPRVSGENLEWRITRAMRKPKTAEEAMAAEGIDDLLEED